MLIPPEFHAQVQRVLDLQEQAGRLNLTVAQLNAETAQLHYLRAQAEAYGHTPQPLPRQSAGEELIGKLGLRRDGSG